MEKKIPRNELPAYRQKAGHRKGNMIYYTPSYHFYQQYELVWIWMNKWKENQTYTALTQIIILIKRCPRYHLFYLYI